MDNSSPELLDIAQHHNPSWPQLRPIEAPRLYLVAASQIAETIASGRWQPRSKLPSERELSSIFQISRSSVRQALTALEAIGVIRKKTGVGSFIQEEALEIISQELVTELVHEGDPTMLTEARQVLEPGIAELAAQSRDDEDLARMEAKLKEMDQFGHPELSATEYVDADIDFHLFIAYATHNPLLIRLYREVSEQMRQRVWLIAAHPVVERRACRYQEQHREVFESIRNGEAIPARRLMRAHLQSIRDNLQAISEITSEHPAR